MGNNKNKKKQQTGGLQPKGGAYANQDANLAATGGVIDPMVANAALKEKAKADKEKAKQKGQKSKDKQKEKNDDKPRSKGKLGMLIGAIVGAGIGVLIGYFVGAGSTANMISGGIIGLVVGAIFLGIIFRNLTKFKETGAELKKVRWPSFSKTLKQTGVVVSVVVIFSLVVFALDFGLNELYKLLTKGF